MEINYGLVGFGTIAKTHLLGLRNMPLLGIDVPFTFNLKALYSTHPEENKKAAMDSGFDTVVDTMEKLVSMSDVNVVDICTPNFLHHDQVLEAVKARKNVYCEKPLGLNSRETAELVKAAEETNIINQVAFVMRFNPAVAAAHAAINLGIIGKPYAFRGEILHSGYLTRNKTMSWRLQKSKSGGGALVDLGVHQIDLVRFLLGEVESVSCATKTVVEERRSSSGELQRVDVDDWASLTMQLNDGAVGTIECSRLAVGNDANRLWIYGDKGSLFIDLDYGPYSPLFYNEHEQRFYVDSKVLKQDPFYEKIGKLYPNPKLSQGFMVDAHLTSLLWFLNSVSTGTQMDYAPTFKDGHQAELIMDAAYESDLNGHTFIKVG
jgi:predicted dehydrogenase